MSTKKILYSHDFFENAIAGMFWYLRELMKPYRQTLNNKQFFIGLMNTGLKKEVINIILKLKII